MKKSGSILKTSTSRRRFLQHGMIAAGGATLGTGLFPGGLSAFAQGGSLSQGDAAILSFLAAAEILEADLWEQYWELTSGAVRHKGDFASKINPSTGKPPVGTGGNKAYTTALQTLDPSMPQYIVDNTDDEFSHTNFLLEYLKSRGADTSVLDLLVGPPFPDNPRECSNRIGQQRTAHQPYQAHHRYQLLGSVPLRQHKPRSRRHRFR